MTALAPADLVLLAGEASGDLLGALLLREMRALRPDLRCEAIGAQRLLDAGAALLADSSEWASIGPISALGKIPVLYLTMLWMARRFAKQPPRLLVPIDFGAFNLRLIMRLRRGQYRGRIIYYFPPGAWLFNERQARDVAAAATPVATFPQQRDFYRSLSLPVEYFGHPLVSAIAPRSLQPPSGGTNIIAYPGSRKEEVDLLLPVIARTAKQLASERGATFTIAASSRARAKQIETLWARADGPAAATIVRGDAIETSRDSAHLAWVASGTAVLEVALRAIPQIAFYKISAAQYRIAQRRVPQFVHGPITLPNLVLGRPVVPELLQGDFTPERLHELTERYLDDPRPRAEQAAVYAELRAALGPPDALRRIARFMLEQMPA
ncbi:MAG TPA: hypothetical protein VN934_00865 [Candidatus Tumulicola sp.]|nr:hypothetical protein [Candidatus Tumulicola sp.]